MVRSAGLLAACLLFGCFLAACSVGPRYARPSTPSAGGWSEVQAPGDVDASWWRSFGDPQLSALLDEATASAPDLRVADARLAEARAMRDLARGGALPEGGASAAYSRDRVSANGEIPIGRIPGFSREFSLFDGGFDASWEVDLWGRHRRQIEAAEARLSAAQEARRGVLIRLRAEIARDYLDLRAAQADAAAAREAATAQRKLAELALDRMRRGEASRADAERAEAAARAAAADPPVLDADARDAALAIAALLGRPPEEMTPALLTPRTLPDPPAVLAPGLRSDILRRRPDVSQAERDLAAATADVGVATADLFPRLTLAGAIGQQSQSISDIALAGSSRFHVGPTLTWPILQRGSIRAQIRAAGARADAAAAAYESAVFGALADSESALGRFGRATSAAGEAQAALAAAQAARVLAEARYAAGEDDLGGLLNAQLAELQARRSFTRARLAELIAAVSAYKSLGL